MRPEAHGPGLKVEAYHCGGWCLHASAPRRAAQVQMFLHDGPASAGLQVKHVLRVPDQRSHASVEVRPLGVGHSLKALLPHRILLVTDQKEHDWHRGGVGEVALR
jgi:hypothetical protein